MDTPERDPREDELLIQTGTPLTEPAFRERLWELAPSAKLVARTLHDAGPLTPEEIADRSLLPPRTVQDAVTNLGEANLLEARQSDMDCPTQVYHLTSPSR